MKLLKYMLVFSLVFGVGILSVSAQDGGNDAGSGTFAISQSTEKGDCNNNGIDDLDEFLPPPCYGQTLTDATGDAGTQDGDAIEIIVIGSLEETSPELTAGGDSGIASYEPDQGDIDGMVADCGEDNWGLIYEDDGVVGYYCLN